MGKQHGQTIGIEAKIEYVAGLELIGEYYESWRRTALNWLQLGLTEAEVEKRLQKDFNLQWAWADSIATEAKQTYDQLKTAKTNQITLINTRIKAKTSKAKEILDELEKRIKTPFKNQQELEKFELKLKGLKSKILKISSLQKYLKKLNAIKRLHICFGSQKLFNAQHHLADNDYSQHSEWLVDWKKKRSGRFYCIGKSQAGGGTMLKVEALDDMGNYQLNIAVPRLLQAKLGKYLKLNFQLSDEPNRRRKSDLNYALTNLKPITTQVFRREHKDNQWYIHLTTYGEEIPIVHSLKNGCLGLDFNKDRISATYVKPDGNIAYCTEFPFTWIGLSTGQRKARMRDIVKEIVLIAEAYGCAISIESLDFSKKKAAMSEESTLYNEMLSNLSTALFTTTLESRCKRYRVQLMKVNPAFTSIIGMIKFMTKYGLNSGTAAAMAVARRAMNQSESLPSCLVRPEDQARHSWSAWNRVARYIKHNFIKRAQLFQWEKALEGILNKEHELSLQVTIETGE